MEAALALASIMQRCLADGGRDYGPGGWQKIGRHLRWLVRILKPLCTGVGSGIEVLTASNDSETLTSRDPVTKISNTTPPEALGSPFGPFCCYDTPPIVPGTPTGSAIGPIDVVGCATVLYDLILADRLERPQFWNSCDRPEPAWQLITQTCMLAVDAMYPTSHDAFRLSDVLAGAAQTWDYCTYKGGRRYGGNVDIARRRQFSLVVFGVGWEWAV